MECPVCYCDTNLNHLVCGHQLCRSCTKKWHTTCPMCRESLCFHGIIDQKKQWNRERCHQVYVDIMNELMTDCPEECIPYLPHCLSIVQERYTFVMDNYPEVSTDGMDIILRNVWIPLETEQIYYHDIPTYIHSLFVNRTEHGNLSSIRYTKCYIEMDLFHKLIDLIDMNSDKIPEGDYLKMCDTIKALREQVKPPSFLDQTIPIWVSDETSQGPLVFHPTHDIQNGPIPDGQPRDWLDDELPSDPDTAAQRDREQFHQRWRECHDDEERENPGLNQFLRELHEEWSDPVEPGAYYPPPRQGMHQDVEVSLSE